VEVGSIFPQKDSMERILFSRRCCTQTFASSAPPQNGRGRDFFGLFMLTGDCGARELMTTEFDLLYVQI
jgi:hypothetical protein